MQWPTMMPVEVSTIVVEGMTVMQKSQQYSAAVSGSDGSHDIMVFVTRVIEVAVTLVVVRGPLVTVTVAGFSRHVHTPAT